MCYHDYRNNDMAKDRDLLRGAEYTEVVMTRLGLGRRAVIVRVGLRRVDHFVSD